MGVSDSINGLAMILGPATGSAIIGANPRFLGVLPGICGAAGLWDRHGFDEPSERKGLRERNSFRADGG